MLNRLSVFASGFTLSAAEHICGRSGGGTDEVLELVSALVDKSLVQVDLREGRFRLHEIPRAYTASRLDADGEAGIFRDRHPRPLHRAGDDPGANHLDRRGGQRRGHAGA